ncbi:MAG: energy-coupling factor transporter ATPase [Euryarchaeota archaeon]|nr:MAG: ABC transporter ATP-binding protein [ANME-2 cluster archaeon]MEA1865595.1 energy-coupling factor transporter ATPase [Euryarchaeota archaeon]
MIDIQNLTYTYPNIAEPTLRDINLHIDDGEFVLLLGASGCGKSTLIQCLNGLVPKVANGNLEGEIVINGKNLRNYKVHQMASDVGIIFQNPDTQLFSLTVGKDVAFGPENLGMPKEEILKRMDVAMRIVGIDEMRNRFIFTLSGGEKQRVAIAGTLAMEPHVMVLDEPTSDLDPAGTGDVLALVRRLNREKDMTIILIEHKIDEVVHLTDRVVVMDRGEIIMDGTPEEIFDHKYDQLKSIGISLPQLSEISHAMKNGFGDFGGDVPTFMSYETILTRLCHLLRKRPENLARFARLHVQSPQPTASAHTAASAPTAAAKPGIVIKNLTHTFDDGTVGLDDINLTIPERDFVALIGHNGAGKTTLVSHLIGLLRPEAGTIVINGGDISKMPVAAIARKVGYLFQNPDNQIFTDSVIQELAFGLKNIGLHEDAIEERVNMAIAMMELEEFRERHPHSLSRGQRQRLAVASILAMEPEIIVLDEPTTGQDWGHVNKFLRQIRHLNELGKTIILITHDMNLVAGYARRTVVMDKGKIVLDGDTRSVFSKPEILEKTGITLPIITRLSPDLGKEGLDVPPLLTVEELREILN